MTDPHLARVIEDLSRPEAYPAPAPVDVIQTHCSVVFLVGDEVYKVKKPVDLGFLDYSTLERRATMCQLEVDLNRRLAPDVYRGALPVGLGADGRLRIGQLPAVEWVVHMRRLPEEATLRQRLRSGTIASADLEAVGARLAAFHARAVRDSLAVQAASFGTVAALARDNVSALRARIASLGQEAVDQLAVATEAALAGAKDRIERRAATRIACQFHGDLRLDHVYLFPGADPPGEVVIIDGVEFDDLLRRGDPVADLAFLAMDLQAAGAWEHAERLVQAWLAVSGDSDAAPLLPLYISYRSAVRAKVATVLLGEEEVPQASRDAALARARLHLALAVRALR